MERMVSLPKIPERKTPEPKDRWTKGGEGEREGLGVERYWMEAEKSASAGSSEWKCLECRYTRLARGSLSSRKQLPLENCSPLLCTKSRVERTIPPVRSARQSFIIVYGWDWKITRRIWPRTRLLQWGAEWLRNISGMLAGVKSEYQERDRGRRQFWEPSV